MSRLDARLYVHQCIAFAQPIKLPGDFHVWSLDAMKKNLTKYNV